MEEFDIDETPETTLAPNWNTAPTQPIYVVTQSGNKRSLIVARWGLIPSWSKDAKNAARTVNARVESVAEKPSFRAAFRSRRCIVPADGYYEWYTLSGSTQHGPSPKQPFYIHRRDAKSLAMAGIYEFWQDPESGLRVTSAAIITTPSQGQPAAIHDRMPVLLPRERYEPWLSSSAERSEDLLALLDVEVDGLGLACDPISRRVNSTRNNAADLIEPLPFAGEPTPL